jgi:hypothetical protein
MEVKNIIAFVNASNFFLFLKATEFTQTLLRLYSKFTQTLPNL